MVKDEDIIFITPAIHTKWLGYQKNIIKDLFPRSRHLIIDGRSNWPYAWFYWMKEIKDTLPTYLGNDIVDEMINNNNQLYGNENITFISNDMLSTLKSLKDKSFDFIICRHTFEHLPTDYNIDVINEIYRVSKMALITSNPYVGNSEVDFNGVLARGINLNSEPYFSILGNHTNVYDGNNFYVFK